MRLSSSRLPAGRLGARWNSDNGHHHAPPRVERSGDSPDSEAVRTTRRTASEQLPPWAWHYVRLPDPNTIPERLGLMMEFFGTQHVIRHRRAFRNHISPWLRHSTQAGTVARRDQFQRGSGQAFFELGTQRAVLPRLTFVPSNQSVVRQGSRASAADWHTRWPGPPQTFVSAFPAAPGLLCVRSRGNSPVRRSRSQWASLTPQRKALAFRGPCSLVDAHVIAPLADSDEASPAAAQMAGR